MRCIALFLFCMVLFSCSPEKRLSRILKHNPGLLDTIVKIDTILKNEIKHDTSFILSGNTDTFYIDTAGLKFSIIREFDTLRVKIYSPPDTIVKIKEKTSILIREKKKIPFILKAAGWLVLLAFLYKWLFS